MVLCVRQHERKGATMAAINSVTDLSLDGDIAVLTVDSPPVNALSAAVRDGIRDGMVKAGADPNAKAIVLICGGRTFIAGADISEFGKPPSGSSLPETQAAIENAPKPVIAALHGTALGGGFELALMAHYRVAVPSAKVGLPEIKLGLIPGAGGTIRLPRLVGVEKALDMITSGAQLGAKEAQAAGIIDEIVEEGKLREGALAFARKVVAEKRPLKKIRDQNSKIEAARARPEIFENFRKANARKFRGFEAPEVAIKSVENAVNMPFDEAMKTERQMFINLIPTTQSAAQRYAFFAERQVAKIPDVPADTATIPINKLDGIVKQGAILATNTSYLNVDEIASATKRPEFVIGLHFFSPANVMRLLEIVRGAKTSKSVVATCMQLARKIGKIGVLVGVCHGFVGNRMLAQRQREAQKLILEGAMPWDVDRVLYDFGMPMGPFAMSDLAGLDIGWSKETSSSSTIREILCEMDRRGQKTGAGFYDYDESRRAKPSPVVEKIILDFAQKKGVNRRKISDEEILERCIYPMINEGAKILEEGKAIRASDIDIVWINGYGWPVYRGGPMFYGDTIGLDKVLGKMREFEGRMGDDFKPAALLEKVVAEGKRFQDL